jgi:DNA-directed RNA polymerase subunit RPC12/RpoP
MMTFDFPCSQCGQSNTADWRQAGRPMLCAGCGASILVPVPCEMAEPAAESTASWRPVAAIRFTCSGCGRKYSTKPAMAGKRIKCGGCGAKIYVPGPDATVPERAPRPRPATIERPRAVADPEPEFDFIVEDDEPLPAPMPAPTRAFEPEENPEPAPRVRKKKKKRGSGHGSIRSRIFGVFLMFVSIFLIGFTWAEARSAGLFRLQVAFAGPFAFFLGFWWLLEGPPLDETPRFREMSALGKFFNIVGAISGLLYLNFLRSGHPFGNPF